MSNLNQNIFLRGYYWIVKSKQPVWWYNPHVSKLISVKSNVYKKRQQTSGYEHFSESLPPRTAEASFSSSSSSSKTSTRDTVASSPSFAAILEETRAKKVFLVPVPGHETRHELTGPSPRSRFIGGRWLSGTKHKLRRVNVSDNLTAREQILGINCDNNKTNAASGLCKYKMFWRESRGGSKYNLLW